MRETHLQKLEKLLFSIFDIEPKNKEQAEKQLDAIELITKQICLVKNQMKILGEI